MYFDFFNEYKTANVFTLPAIVDHKGDTEGLGVVLIEAMELGLPIVASNVGGIPEGIDHKRNGYVADYRDAEDLARGIRWVLTSTHYESLSDDCVRKVSQCYSQQSVALRYLDVYEQAMAFKHYRL